MAKNKICGCKEEMKELSRKMEKVDAKVDEILR